MSFRFPLHSVFLYHNKKQSPSDFYRISHFNSLHEGFNNLICLLVILKFTSCDRDCISERKVGIDPHSSILAWRNSPGTEDSGGLPSIGLQRVGHAWATITHSPSFLAGTVSTIECVQRITKSVLKELQSAW